MSVITNHDRSQLHAEEVVERPYLSGRWSSGQSVEAPINRDNFLVGRHIDADLVVPHNAVYISGRHFEVQLTPVGYALVDLSSTNGTYLNNERIPPMTAVPLKNGDISRPRLPASTPSSRNTTKSGTSSGVPTVTVFRSTGRR